MALPQKRLKFKAASCSAVGGGLSIAPSRYQLSAIAKRGKLCQIQEKLATPTSTSQLLPSTHGQSRNLSRPGRVSPTWKQRLQHLIAVSLLLGIMPLMFEGSRAVANTNSVLSDSEISQQLQQLPGWTRQGDEIVNTFEFKDFVAAVDFVNQLVEPAESAGHHPDLTIAYNKVTVSLTTHDAGGITNQDFALAETISQLAAE